MSSGASGVGFMANKLQWKLWFQSSEFQNFIKLYRENIELLPLGCHIICFKIDVKFVSYWVLNTKMLSL
jgi:hypothetical protein